jgi:hypothetical protein
MHLNEVTLILITVSLVGIAYNSWRSRLALEKLLVNTPD